MEHIEPVKTVKDILKDQDKVIDIALNIIIFGGVAIVLLSLLIKFLINKL